MVEQPSRLPNKILVLLAGTKVSRGHSDAPFGKVFVRPGRQGRPRFLEVYLRPGRFLQAMQPASRVKDSNTGQLTHDLHHLDLDHQHPVVYLPF